MQYGLGMALCLVTVGCVPQSHEVLTSIDGGAPSPSPWVELVGGGWQQFGVSLAFGDLDDDGLDDIILANRTNDDTRGGSVVILYGRPDRLDGTFLLEASDVEILGPPHEIGDLYVDVGDVDGDGVDDLLVGADGNSTQPSTIHLLYGGSRWSGRPPIEALGATIAPAAIIGGWVRAAGDVDGDGYEDILAGSPGPEAYLLRGRAARYTGAVEWAPAATFRSMSTEVPIHFIHAPAGDLDGDGLADLLVGEQLGTDGRLELGIYYGGPHLAGSLSLADADASLLLPQGGVHPNGGFDLNADGLADFVTMSNRESTSAVQVFLGSATRMAGAIDPSSAAFTITGAMDYDQTGEAISAGDANGDGVADLLLGSTNFRVVDPPIGERPVGRVYRFSTLRDGPITDADKMWEGRIMPMPDHFPSHSPSVTYAERLGSAVAQDGDFDGDGYADALLGQASDYSPHGGQRVRLVYGSP